MYITADSSAAQGIYALDRKTGETQWEITDPNIPEPLVHVGEIILASYNRYEIAKFDTADGEWRWSKAMYDSGLFAPVVGLDADYIVVVGRSRSPVGKALFGSVTQGDLLHAECPVLAVMVQREEDED